MKQEGEITIEWGSSVLPNTFCRHWVQWSIRENSPCGGILIWVYPSSGTCAEGTPHQWSNSVVINWSCRPASESELLSSHYSDALIAMRERVGSRLTGLVENNGKREESLLIREVFFFLADGGEARLTTRIRYKSVPRSTSWLSSGLFRGKAFSLLTS